MRRRLVAAAALLLCALPSTAAEEWGFPIRLGAGRSEVLSTLGSPSARAVIGSTTIVEGVEGEEFQPSGASMESFHSVGLSVGFDDDRVTSVILSPARPGYPGRSVYAGSTIAGVRVSDLRPEVVAKLGAPTERTEPRLPDGVDAQLPVARPAFLSYVWRRDHYTIEIVFLAQPRRYERGIDPRDSIEELSVYCRTDSERHDPTAAACPWAVKD